MNQKFRVLLFIVFFGTQLSAQADDIVSAKNEKNSPQAAITDSSAANRVDKRFSVFAEMAMGIIDSSGFSASYFIDPVSQIHIDYYNHTLPLTAKVFEAISGGSDQLKGVSTGVHYKRFLGNSFFLRGGLDHRRIELLKSRTGSYFRGTAVNAVLAIGNEWQWRHFTLGFDWFRGYLPLTSQITEEKYATTDQQKMIEDEQNAVLQKSTGMIGIRLGASF